MKIQMIISGVGGQGVLFATRIFAAMALAEGHPLIGSETHGMSQRGGSVITHLKIGEFDSPLVKKGTADILLSLEKNEAYRTISFVKHGADGKNGGLCFVNAPDPDYMDERIKAYLMERGIEIHVFGADQVARQAGSVRSANIALIGFACAHPRLQDLSLKIFDKGFSEGRKSLGS
jgi:indolepyruvate ferredoxin oxidoreductase beta subunit